MPNFHAMQDDCIKRLKDQTDIHRNEIKDHMETRLGEYDTQFA